MILQKLLRLHSQLKRVSDGRTDRQTNTRKGAFNSEAIITQRSLKDTARHKPNLSVQWYAS